jgi:hypothetical protein
VPKRFANGGRRAGSQLEPGEGCLRVARDLTNKAAVRRELVVIGQEPLRLRVILEGIEENGLANPAQPAELYRDIRRLVITA